MIDAKDLAIGDWVYDGQSTQFPMFVIGIGVDYVYLDFPGNEGDVWESTPDELYGIPLTDELLAKLGFVSNDFGLWKKTEKRREVTVSLERGFVFIEAFDNKWLDSRGWCHGIKHLHQLQNLFRTIAKEDFKVEL